MSYQSKQSIAVRKRKEFQYEFLEVFFKGNKTNDALIPSFDVIRFKGRFDMPVYTESLSVTEIKKSAPQISAHRTRQNILSDGIWFIESDWIAKGGVKSANVPYVPTFFGIPVQVSQEFINDWPKVQDLMSVKKEHSPIVVYHGTAKENIKSILDNGLQPSYGMFGTAIYFGSFWKAFRFACLTQDYQDRHGAIIRCLCFWKKTYLRNQDVEPKCFCSNCRGSATYADHLQKWATTGADNVMLYPVMLNGHWVVRNEEYAVTSDKNIILDTIGFAKRIKTGPYEPWDRTICIL